MRMLLGALLAVAPTAVLACDGGQLTLLMRTQLPPEATESFDVAEVQSVEGGSWDVHRAADGRVTDIVRTDYGETGRVATRLTVSSSAAYAVTVTRYAYSAPIGVSGSSTVREERDIHVFCDGRLYLPAEDYGQNADLSQQAVEALATFDAPEIAASLPELDRTP